MCNGEHRRAFVVETSSFLGGKPLGYPRPSSTPKTLGRFAYLPQNMFAASTLPPLQALCSMNTSDKLGVIPEIRNGRFLTRRFRSQWLN